MKTKAEIQEQAFELPKEERIELVMALWESIGAEARPVPDWHRDLIRERLAALEGLALGERSSPWDLLSTTPSPPGPLSRGERGS